MAPQLLQRQVQVQDVTKLNLFDEAGKVASASAGDTRPSSAGCAALAVGAPAERPRQMDRDSDAPDRRFPGLTLDTSSAAARGETFARQHAGVSMPVRAAIRPRESQDLMEAMDVLMSQQDLLMKRLTKPSLRPLPTACVAAPPAMEREEADSDRPLGITVYLLPCASGMFREVLIDNLCKVLDCERSRLLYCDMCVMAESTHTRSRCEAHWIDILPSRKDSRFCEDLIRLLRHKNATTLNEFGILQVDCHQLIAQQASTTFALESARSILHSPEIGPLSVPVTPTRKGEVAESALLSVLGPQKCEKGATGAGKVSSWSPTSTFTPTSSFKGPLSPMVSMGDLSDWCGYQPRSPISRSGKIGAPARTCSEVGGQERRSQEREGPECLDHRREEVHSREVSNNSLRILFEALDTDGDGCLSLHEFVYGMQRNADLIVALSRDLTTPADASNHDVTTDHCRWSWLVGHECHSLSLLCLQ